MPIRADFATVSVPRFSNILTTALLPELFSQKNQISVSGPRLVRGLATAFLIFVFVFISFLFLQDFRREIGNSLIQLGGKLKGNTDTPPDASSSTPVQISNPSSESAPSVSNPIPETLANEALDQSGPTVSAPTIQGTVNTTGSRLADRNNSRQDFADMNSRRGGSALARQLWAAVEAGDTSAEVALAQLYLTGEGVPTNCEQARVLLRAASRNGNIEALQQLRILNKSTCR